MGNHYLAMYEASRSKVIEFDGNLREYMAHLGITGLQQRDRDASPSDVVRGLAKKKSRYRLKDGRSVELSLDVQPTPGTLLSYEIVRIVKARGGVELGRTVIGSATLRLAAPARFFVETKDSAVKALEDFEKIDVFCRELYLGYANAGRTINASSAAWMARKVIESVGGKRVGGRERATNVWYLPEEGVDTVRRYIEGLGWFFTAFPVEMSDALEEALGRKKASA